MEFDIKNKLEEYISASRFGLVDFVVKGDKYNKIIEIFVDNETGVNVDELGKLNRELWDVLKQHELTKNLMKIVVSSPGTERPVKFFWQLKKHIRRKIEIITNKGIVQGVLKDLNELPEGNLMVIEQKTGKGKKMTIETSVIKFSSDIIVKIVSGF